MKKKWKRAFLLGTILMTMLVLAGCGKKINLNDYVSVEFDGYEGYGTAVVTFDSDKFEEDCSTIKLSNSYAELFGGSTADYYRDWCFTYETDKKTGLVNGDKVTLTWNCEEELVSSNTDGTLVYTDIEYTVSGLKEVSGFDPFDFITVSFEGTAPAGTAIITKDESQELAQYLDYTASNSALSNGDEVTVNISFVHGTDETTFADMFGMLPSETEKKYTVAGLDEYASSATQIPDGVMNEMLTKGEEAVREVCTTDWTGYFDIDIASCEYLGNIFCVEESGQSSYWNNMNELYLLYKVNTDIYIGDSLFSSERKFAQSQEIYLFVRYSNIIVSADGASDIDISSYWVCDNYRSINIDGAIFSLGQYGYDSIEELRESIEESNSGYIIEDNLK